MAINNNEKKLISVNLFNRQIKILKRVAKDRGCAYGQLIRDAVDAIYPQPVKTVKSK